MTGNDACPTVEGPEIWFLGLGAYSEGVMAGPTRLELATFRRDKYAN